MSRLPASLSQDLHYARVESYMRRLSTFEEWPLRSLRQVSAISEVKHIVRGTVLSQRNHEAIGVWVLMSGHLEVFCPSRAPCHDSPSAMPRFSWFPNAPKRPKVTHELSHRAPVEVVDEICLTSEDSMHSVATVIASCCCEILFIPKDVFFALLEEQPSLARLNSAQAAVPATGGSDSEQPLISWSWSNFRSSMHRSSVATARSNSRTLVGLARRT